MSTIRIALAILIISSDAHGHVTGSLCRPRPKHALNGSGRSLATTYLKIEPPPRVCVCVCKGALTPTAWKKYGKDRLPDDV